MSDSRVRRFFRLRLAALPLCRSRAASRHPKAFVPRVSIHHKRRDATSRRSFGGKLLNFFLKATRASRAVGIPVTIVCVNETGRSWGVALFLFFAEHLKSYVFEGMECSELEKASRMSRR